MKKLFIDATNIHSGGGLLHLIKILECRPVQFNHVIVAASRKTLDMITDEPWILKYTHDDLNSNYFRWWTWRKKIFRAVLREYGDPVLFSAGTLKPPFDYPFFSICQNLLPLEWHELFRYKLSWVTLRLLLLRFLHLDAYKNAEGVIFLTRYCFYALPMRIRKQLKKSAVIPHGVDHDIFRPAQRSDWESREELDLLYISVFSAYKHQDKIIDAVFQLNREGYKVKITLVGDWHDKVMMKKVHKLMNRNRDIAEAVTLFRQRSFDEVPALYRAHDVFIFGSSCETFGMILTEAMASAKPILCSWRSSMPETLDEAGIYFDPLSVDSIKWNILKIYRNKGLLPLMSIKALERSRQYDWKTTAEKTYAFLSE